MRELIDLQPKLHGWHGTYRGRFLLLQRNVLTKEEFILYDASLSFSDWDKINHPKIYGSFDLTQQEIELLLGFSTGYVSKHSKKLLQLDLWQKRADGRIQVLGFKLIEIGLLKVITKQKLLVDPEIIFANSQSQFENLQNEITNKQVTSPKATEGNYPQTFANSQNPSAISDVVSYKDKSIVSPIGIAFSETQSAKTDVEPIGLSEDDIEWINENLPTSESEGGL